VTVQLPTGTVTFLFTDVEGSTRLWDEHHEAMPAALIGLARARAQKSRSRRCSIW
jgi:class 3 adenylate cyclase